MMLDEENKTEEGPTIDQRLTETIWEDTLGGPGGLPFQDPREVIETGPAQKLN